MKANTKAKFKVDQFFMQNEKKALFKVVEVEWQGTLTKPSTSKVKEHTKVVNDWLYRIEYQGVNEGRYGNYYEGRLTEECSEIVNQDLAKAVYS